MRLGVLSSLVSLLFIAGCGGSTDDPPVQNTPETDLLIRNVTIIDGTGAPARIGSIRVNDGRIVEIADGDGAGLKATTVIEGNGKYVIPGFVDLLTHIASRSHVSGDAMDLIQLRASEALTQEIVVDHAADQSGRLAIYKDILRASLKGGVTTFVDSITSIGDISALQAEINDEEYPNFYSLGPILSPPMGHPYNLDGTEWKYELPISQPFDQWEATLRSDVESWFKDQIVSGVKVAVDAPDAPNLNVPEPVIAAICETAKKYNKPCFFLSGTDTGMQAAAAAGANVKLAPPMVFTSMGIDPPADATWAALEAADVSFLSVVSNYGANFSRYVTSPGLLTTQPLSYYPSLPAATQMGYESLINTFAPVAAQPPNWMDPISRYFHANNFLVSGSLDALKNAKEMHGLKVIPTTDAGSVWVFHGTLSEELVYLSQGNGLTWDGFMTPEELIPAVTLQPATIMNLQDDIGSIEVGKKADLLLLSGDPLQNIANVSKIESVIKSGKVVTP